MSTHTLETACRRILGSMNHRTMEELNPGQHVEAIHMMDEGWPVDLVAEAVMTLQRWYWFRASGVTCEPWEVGEAEWRLVMSRKPWNETAHRAGRPEGWLDPGQGKQLDLFGEEVA